VDFFLGGEDFFFGGVEGESLYIDSNGDFCYDRIKELAKNFRSNVLKKIEKDQ